MIDLNLFGAPAFLVDVVPGGFRFRSINRARELATQSQSSALAGRSPHQIYSKEVADHLVRQFNACLTCGHALDYEEIVDSPDQSRVFLTTISPVSAEDGSRIACLMGVAVDITARKRAEDRMRQQAERAERDAVAAHERLRDALDLLPEAIVFFDADDRFVLWNQKYTELYPNVSHLLARGLHYPEIIRAAVQQSALKDRIADADAYIADLVERLHNPGPAVEEQISNGRWVRREERRTADGGTIGIRVDITDLKVRQEAFRPLFEDNPLPMWLYDPVSLTFLDVNQAAVAAYGYRHDDFVGMSVLNIRPEDEREALRASMAMETDFSQARRGQRHQRADGSLIDVEIYVRSIDYHGRMAVLVGVVDVTERRRTEARIAHLAHHDALTELPNRVLFQERLTEEFTRHRFQTEQAVVMFLDLDHFKEVNDGLGHAEGDALLRQVARRLRQCLRRDDLVARLGGDEFAILLPRIDHPDHVTELAHRIVEVVSKPYRLSESEAIIGVSIGIAFMPEDAESSAEVLRRADTALYRAKEGGRGTYRIYEAIMDAKLQARRALIHDLSAALNLGQFHLEFQPLINLTSNRINACEALLRWRHPVRGLVSPAEFIPLAEDIGLIVQLGDWVIQQACREACHWPSEIGVAINLSAVQFRKRNLVNVITETLQRTGLSPHRLELEITETIVLAEEASTTDTLNQLRAMGVRIAMDDFGTGYSSLSYLRSFRFDKIKMDRSFISGMHDNPHCQAIIRAVAELGRALDIVTTAEGVESLEQLTALRGFGFSEAQGYLFSPPRRDVIIRPLLNIWQKSNPAPSRALVPAIKAR